MTLLNILQFPNPELKKAAEPIETIDSEIKTLAENMLETMYNSSGIGLAATQINVKKRLFVMDLSENKEEPLIFINPVITKTEGQETGLEGCLSFPGVYAKITRATKITVEYLSLENEKMVMDAEGLLCICIQHEIDHLNGVTIYDHLSPLKQTLLKRKLKKFKEKTSS